MKCPRCQNVFSATPDATGVVTCPSCGSRLRARPAAAAMPAPAAGGPAPPAARPVPSPAPAAPRPAPVAAAPPPTPATGPALVKTGPVPVPASMAGPALATARSAVPDTSATLDAILDEIRALRETQHEILELLRRPAAAASEADEPFASFGHDHSTPRPAVRTRRRKSVLMIDDDTQALAAAVGALERAEVPVRTAIGGNAGLAAIAEEKPDVIVMELGMGGSMGGKDVINMIKATMEWVDVPILLYTRVPIENQREARQIHGADEYVLKGPAGPDALVARVVALFRKG